jgi:hypothetical protein
VKKFLYIISVVILGLLLSLLVHASAEMIALKIIFSQPEKYFETIWWQEWSAVHRVGSLVLSCLGSLSGLYFGIKWWEPYGSKPGFFHWRKIVP